MALAVPVTCALLGGIFEYLVLLARQTASQVIATVEVEYDRHVNTQWLVVNVVV